MLQKLKDLGTKISPEEIYITLAVSLLLLLVFVALLGLGSGIFHWTIAFALASVIIAYLVEKGIV